jgi:hypothetical protein
MSDSHLRNTINYIERRAEKGILAVVDGGGFDLEETWFVTDIIYGMEALKTMNHAAYVAEADRRAVLPMKEVSE